MAPRYLKVPVFAGLFLLTAWGTGLADGSKAWPAGHPSPLVTAPQTPTARPAQKGAAAIPPSVAPSPPQAIPAAGAVQPAGVDDIRDIRGPLHIPVPFLWLYYALGASLLVTVGAAVWRWLRKHKALRAKRAYEIAFEELKRAKALMKPELADAFSVAVSNAVRTYIETRFAVRVTRHTTEEFMARIQAEPSGDLAGYRDLLADFLGHCDLAKFARFLLTPDQMEAMYQSAWSFVDQTRPRPEEKKAQQVSEGTDMIPEAAPVVDTSRERPTAGMLRALRQRFISKKATVDTAFGAGSAVAAGGR